MDGNGNRTEYTYNAIRELTNVHLDMESIVGGTQETVFFLLIPAMTHLIYDEAGQLIEAVDGETGKVIPMIPWVIFKRRRPILFLPMAACS